MKKILLPLCVSAMCFSAQAQISNSGFERWNKMLLFEHPVSTTASMSSNYETFFDNGLLNVKRVVTEDNSILRIENIMGSEIVQPGFFIFGQVPTDNEVFKGGNPISDVEMTGISMDMRFAIASETEGFVIVQFKDGDMPVGEGNNGTGTYLFNITGTQDWGNVEFQFDNPIDPAANTCVIAFASGDVFNSDTPFADGSFMEIDNVEFIGSETVVPGGDFESWMQVKPLYVPEDCYVDLHPFHANYEQSFSEYSGNYALRLNSTMRENTVDVGYALLGNKNDEDEIIPTSQIGNNTLLSFRYFYSGIDDIAQAKIVFYTESQNGFEMAQEHFIDLNVNENYELIEFPFGELLDEEVIRPTHLTLEFKSSLNTMETPAQDGSILLVDEVALETALGLTHMLSAQHVNRIEAYPNPTIGRVVFDFEKRLAGYFRVFNQNGSQVAIRQFSSTNAVVFDLMPYPAGQYLFRFYHNRGIDVARVIKY